MSKRNKIILIVVGIALLFALFVPLPLPCEYCHGRGKIDWVMGDRICPSCNGKKIQFRTIWNYLNG